MSYVPRLQATRFPLAAMVCVCACVRACVRVSLSPVKVVIPVGSGACLRAAQRLLRRGLGCQSSRTRRAPLRLRYRPKLVHALAAVSALVMRVINLPAATAAASARCSASLTVASRTAMRRE